eukprot:jgi/Ulvmu1/887/UM100_0042.1
MYMHQVEAIEWMWGLWRDGHGGILGDDMGLGKTLTCAAFLAGLRRPQRGGGAAARADGDAQRIRRALIIAPTSLLEHWAAELQVVGVTSIMYHGTKPQRARLRERLFQGHRVAITTYETASNDAEELSRVPARSGFPEDDVPGVPLWDVVVLDESHRAKNPKTKLYKALQLLQARSRLLVTGTPVQNNLLELHALFDLACPGLLGNVGHFRRSFAAPIEASQDRHADPTRIDIGAQCARQLREITGPRLLRREKRSTRMVTVAAARSAAAAGGRGAGELDAAAAADGGGVKLPEKTDVVLWLTMHPTQLRAYKGFLGSSTVKAALNQSGSPLAAIQVLKKICDHPALLSDSAAQKAVRMPRRTARPPPKAAKRKPMPAGAQRAQRAAPVLDDSDSDDAGVLGGGRRSAGIEERVDGVLHGRSGGAAGRGGAAVGGAEVPQGLEDSSDDDGVGVPGGGRREQDEEEYEEESDDGLSNDGLSDFVVDDSEEEGSSSDGGSESVSRSGSDAEGAEEEEWKAEEGAEEDAKALMLRLKKNMSVEDSCKTVVALELLERLTAAGHRTLVFSQSLGLLSMLQRALKCKRIRHLRMDGAVKGGAARHDLVKRYQSSPKYPVFLLSSGVGGLGLTLTAADRVIIMDPAWNPAVDSQSVDRAFRIGQTRHVVVHRLITCGTVEEKIYQRQVYKGALANVSMRDTNPTKYFSGAELSELFQITSEGLAASSTAVELNRLHGHECDHPEPVQRHLCDLATLPHFSATHDHAVLYRSDSAAGNGDRPLAPLPPPPGEVQAAQPPAARSSGGARPAHNGGPPAVAEPARKSAAEIERGKLEQQQRSLQSTVAAINSALQATGGGAGLSDGGAKLHARMETASGELSAIEAALANMAI